MHCYTKLPTIILQSVLLQWKFCSLRGTLVSRQLYSRSPSKNPFMQAAADNFRLYELDVSFLLKLSYKVDNKFSISPPNLVFLSHVTVYHNEYTSVSEFCSRAPFCDIITVSRSLRVNSIL